MIKLEILNLHDKKRRKMVVTQTFWIRFLAELDEHGRINVKDWKPN